MFRLKFKIFFLLGLLFVLAGCAVKPEDLGMSPKQWAQYNKEDQQKILAGHRSVSAAQKKVWRAEPGENWLQVSIQDGLVKRKM